MFDEFDIEDNEELFQGSRTECPLCNKSQYPYCCFCCIALAHTAPAVELPIHVDIYRHLGESPSGRASFLRERINNRSL
jgi:hypothetical protein